MLPMIDAVVGSGAGFSSFRHKVTTCPNAEYLLIGPWEQILTKLRLNYDNVNLEKLICILLKMLVICPGLNVLTHWPLGDLNAILNM